MKENETPMPGAPANDNLYQLLENRFRTVGDKVAFRSTGGGALMTYAELHRLVCRFANALAACGVHPGDRVSAQIDKSIGAVVLYLAALKAGAAYHPLNPAYTRHEVDYFLDDAEPALDRVARRPAPATSSSRPNVAASASRPWRITIAGSLARLAASAARRTC